ncbi:SRPBCC family protein [Streptomyces sp. NPDC059740]|uniref:SRPBCC family protein n=1 Tax=Streptomyces sp. NPDC059740 TaxID=3346926 RepID=UPI0036601CC2
MATTALQVRGPAAAAQVWERYAVPAKWPSWSPQIGRVVTAAGRIAAGVRGTVVGRGGLGRVRFVIEEVDEERRTWTWRVALGPFRLRLTHTVEEEGDGTLTRLVVRGPLLLVLAYRPVARIALRRLVG